MVKRIIKLLNREVGAVNQAALLLGTFTFLSLVLGLIRDRMLTSFIGAGEKLDIYYAAFQIPDLIFVSIASLVSVTVVLPFLVNYISGGKEKKSHEFFNQLFTVFLYVMIVVLVGIFFLMPKLVHIVAPGFNPEQIQELIKVSRILLLSPLLLGVSNLFGSVTQMVRRFYVFALSPLLYNLGIIIGVAILYPIFGLSGLVWGVVIGALMHALIQIPVMVKHEYWPKMVRVKDWKRIKELAATSLPRTLGLSFHSIVLLVLVAIASKIGDGSISIFRLSLNLQNVPLALIGMSYSVAAFPTLTKYFSENNMEAFSRQIFGAMRQIIFWSLPVAALFVVIRAQIVRVILGSQLFTWDDTRLAAATLALFVVSVTAQSLVLLLTRGFYAARNTKTPVIANFVSSLVIVGASFWLLSIFNGHYELKGILEKLFRIKDVAGTALVMLAAAYSVGSILNSFVLYWLFRKKLITRKYQSNLWRTLRDSLIASVVMGGVAYLGLQIFDGVFDLNTFRGIFFQGFLAGIIGIFAGIVVLRLFKNPEIYALGKALKKKFWKSDIVSPGQEEMM